VVERKSGLKILNYCSIISWVYLRATVFIDRILLSESQLSNAIEELKATNLDLTRRCESLEESFNKEKSEKQVRGWSCFTVVITSIFPTGVLYAQLYIWQIAVEFYEKENQERLSAESSRDVLTVDLERVTHDAKRFSEQVMVERVFFLRNGEYSLIEYFHMVLYLETCLLT